MSDTTPLLSLPLILPAQAQKHVTHNEALRLLDILLHLAVLDRTRTEASALPAEGDRHIVASPATGLWQGQEGKIAAWWGGAWAFLAPRPGWQARVLDEAVTLIHSGTDWQDAAELPETLPRLGIATSADATNRLAVASAASLFTHAGDSHRLKINKQAAGDTASLLFQRDYVSHAEFGLLGNTDLGLQTSADGSTFTTALSAEAATGRVTLHRPVTLLGQSEDPSNPPEGMLWHNAAAARVGLHIGGRTLRLDGPAQMPWLLPPSGELVLTTSGAGTSTGTTSGSAGRIDLFPFIPRSDLVVDRLFANCTAAISGALGRLLVYSADALGRPDALLLETADIDLSTTGSKSVPGALALLQGRTYWLGMRHSSTASISTWAANATPDLNGGTAISTSARKVLRRILAWGTAAPANWGFTTAEVNSSAAPAIWLRIV